jgi:hypothetical protein
MSKLWDLSIVVEELFVSERTARQSLRGDTSSSTNRDAQYFTREKEDSSVEQLKALPSHRTGWCEMCFTSLSLLIVSLLRKVLLLESSFCIFISLN